MDEEALPVLPPQEVRNVNIYENDSGDTVRIIEMSAPDEEPEVREPHEFERHTQTIPPERSPEVAQRPWWRRVLGG